MGTQLTGGRKPTDVLDILSVPLGLVFQLGCKLIPAHFPDCQGQFTVLHHALDVQVFQANGVKGANDPGAYLVQEVLPLVPDTLMKPGYYHLLLLVAVALLPGALLKPSAQLSLFHPKPLETVS